MKFTTTLALGASLLLASAAQAADQGAAQARRTLERGKYLIQTSGCNDCHTAGYMSASGKVPERQWLTGDAVGYRGPWGTTYPSNLRHYFGRMSEDGFIQDARSGRMRPPMPWFNLAHMTDADLRAVHRYVRSLGAAGAAAPAYVPPGEEPSTPYFVFVPHEPRSTTARAH